MKFESKFGIGEIVTTHQKPRGGRVYPDFIMEVIAIQFSIEGTVDYICRLPSGITNCFRGSELIGDPEFDQELGYQKNITDFENK